MKNKGPYNLIIPLLTTLVIYWGSYFLFKKKNILKFNGFWNTILLLTFLIPSFGFGIFMMLRYNFTKLREIDFDFMYWHVELSVVMGAIALSHFIQRIKQYLVQLKK
jgi:ABC-type spermidine/putrescine transport system permease subunit II